MSACGVVCSCFDAWHFVDTLLVYRSISVLYHQSENEKLIPNIHDFRFVLPRLEYHNQTWMWHDLALAFKSDCKKVIVPQVTPTIYNSFT